MCRYKDGSRGKCSDKVCGRGFTREAQKEFLVEEHNEFRRKIAKGRRTDSYHVSTHSCFKIQEKGMVISSFLERVSLLQQILKRLNGMMRLLGLHRGQHITHSGMIHIDWLRWADQCPSAISNPHDQVRSMKGYPHQGFCGQNVYFKSSSNPIQAVTIAEAVGSWFHEIDDFDPAEIASFGEAGSPSGEVDHLTALVWHSVGT